MSTKVRSIPNNVEAEQAVLGSVLLASDYFFSTDLRWEEFYLERHAVIWKAMQQVVAAGGKIDFLTTASALESGRLLEQAGGVSYLTALLNSVPTPSHIVEYAALVRREAVRRALLQVSSEIAELAMDSERYATEELLPTAFRKLVGQDRSGGGGSKKLEQVIEELLPELERNWSEQREIPGIETGFDFDMFLGGLQRGEELLLAGYPGKGKTSMACQVAVYASQAGTAVLFFSLEMTGHSLLRRMASEQTGLDSTKVRRGDMTAQQQRQYLDWMELGKQLPLYLDDRPQSVSSMRLEVARRKAMGLPIEVVIVDYTRLVTDRGDNEALRVTQVLRDLKVLAKGEDVAVIALHALNRSLDRRVKDQDGRYVPTLGNLAYGGEYDADVVIMLDYDDERQDKKAFAYVRKNRNGRVGRVEMVYDETLTRWGNAARGEDSSSLSPRSEGPEPWEQVEFS